MRNFQTEARIIRRQVSEAMQRASPSKEYGAWLVLSTTHLGLVTARIREAQSVQERRKQANEFDRIKRAIKKGLAKLNRTTQRCCHAQQKRRARMP